MNVKEAMLQLVETYGLANITHQQLCDHMGVTPGSFYKRNNNQSFTDLVKEFQREGVTGPDMPYTRSKMSNNTLRKPQLVDAAFRLAREAGLHSLTRKGVSDEADVSTTTSAKHFKTLKDIEDAVVQKAIEDRELSILSEAIGRGYEMPVDIRSEAAQYLAR